MLHLDIDTRRNTEIDNFDLLGRKIYQDIVGAENVSVTPSASTGSEDFADMLRVVPGAYCTVGHEGTYPLHSDQFFLDESILPVGASIYARVVEQRSAASA